MDAHFWHQRWSNKQIGFHEGEPNAMLVSNFKHLSLGLGQRVFVPLCGKTLDIQWLLHQEIQVVAVELSELAIEELFHELDVTPTVSELGLLKHYQAKNIDVFVGDFFELTQETVGSVDAVFDRAALVALPLEMRDDYTKHLRQITKNAPQLLITFVYDQALMEGPPFSITSDEVKRHYSADFQIKNLQNLPLTGGFKHVSDVKESIWLLK
ncbi:MAG: thiopurine S-methyltransferase [Arenicella sp.]